MDIDWNIRKREDVTFDIYKNGELHHESIPESFLERQLAPYGIISDRYQEVLRQLAETGNASVSAPVPGKFSVG